MSEGVIMSGDQEAAQRANIRLDNINGDITEIKLDLKETKTMMNETCSDVASLGTKINILITIILGAVGAMIALYLGGLTP